MNIYARLGIASGLLAIIFFVYWISKPNFVYTRVDSLYWKYTVNLRVRDIRSGGEWGNPGRKGFYEEEAFNVDCRRKYYGEEDCNAHPCIMNPKEMCWDTCSEYRRWCDYDYYEWPIRETKDIEGFDHTTNWPSIEITNSINQRIQKVQEYRVIFKSKNDSYILNPTTLKDFKQYEINAHYNLKVGRIRSHHIEEATKISAEKIQ